MQFGDMGFHVVVGTMFEGILRVIYGFRWPFVLVARLVWNALDFL